MRLAIVTARFWPLAGEFENHLLALAEQFRLAGHSVAVATAAWDSSWPERVLVREVSVNRISGAPHGSFRTLRFQFGLGRWFRQHKNNFDLVLVAGLRYEAYVALGTLGSWGVPVVLQADLGGPLGDVAWLRCAPFGRRVLRRCRHAAGIVAASPVAQAELLAAGVDPRRVAFVAPGVQQPTLAGPGSRKSARRALSEVNFDLRTAPEDPVVLASGRFVAASGLAELIRVWPSVAARFPTAKLWIAGDGPERERLWHLISDLDLRARVLLPGTFSPRDELLKAADLFVSPAVADVPVHDLALSLAQGLPCIATDLEGRREWIESETSGLLVTPGSAAALESAVCRLLANPAEGVRLGTAARQRMSQQHTLARCVEQYLLLFESLVR